MIKPLTPTKDQQEVINGWKERNINLSLVGSGKTLMALESFKASGMKKLVVVCLPSKVKDFEEDGNQQGIPIKACLGTPKKRGEILANNDCISISFDSSWRTKELTKFINKDTFIVFDESHKLGSTTSKVTKYWMTQSKKAGYTYIMSGSPISNGKLEQWYPQLFIAKRFKGTFKEFKEKYVIEELTTMGSMRFNQIVGYRNVKDLEKRLDKVCVAIDRANNLIPEDIIYKIDSPRMVNKLKKERWYQTDKGETIALDNASKLFNGLRLCSSGILKGVDKNVSQAKLDRLKDILESTDEKVVIFYQYTLECERIVKMLESIKRPYGIYNGATKDLTGYNEHHNGVAVAQYGSASTGVNLFSDSHVMVFYTMPLSSITYLQARGRITRHTSERNPIYYHLVTNNPIENKIYTTVKNGEDVTNKMIEELIN